MITCLTFRAELRPDTNEPELLAHMRGCDSCLDHAVAVDPGNFFRLLGGEEMVPPGGIEAFTSDVMAQVRLRQTETTLESHRPLSWTRRLAVAATVAAGITGATMVYHLEQAGRVTAPASTASMAGVSAPVTAILTTKPVIETYQSQNATIVEVPADGANVVMIFDESLPADL